MIESLAQIEVSGADARTFLQGQLSCDVDALQANSTTIASISSPQGRVQAVLFVTPIADSFVVSTIGPMLESAVQRLRKYVLRSKVILRATPAAQSTADASAYLLAQIRAGVPHVFAQTTETFVAQSLNLDLLGGISFSKGCYTGQEIIARMHFRGTVKRRMFRFFASTIPPLPGTRIVSNEEHAGDVVYAAACDGGCELLATLHLTHTERDLQIANSNNAALKRLELPYEI